MRKPTATTGTRTEVGEKSADDRDVSPGASESPGPAATSTEEPNGVAGGGEADGETVTTADAEATDRPHFTRPPGMVPPPDRLDGLDGLDGADEAQSETDSTVPVGAPMSVTAPVSAPPEGGVRMRPIEPSAAIGSARVNEAIRASRTAAAGPRGPRRARLTVKRFDPWSVMKFSFAVSLVMFIVMIVAASVLYLALDAMGVFAAANSTLGDLIDSGGGTGESFRITASWVIGSAASLGAINVVLFTALATLGAFIYNVCADLVGGVEVTLAERE